MDIYIYLSLIVMSWLLMSCIIFKPCIVLPFQVRHMNLSFQRINRWQSRAKIYVVSRTRHLLRGQSVRKRRTWNHSWGKLLEKTTGMMGTIQMKTMMTLGQVAALTQRMMMSLSQTSFLWFSLNSWRTGGPTQWDHKVITMRMQTLDPAVVLVRSRRLVLVFLSRLGLPCLRVSRSSRTALVWSAMF